MQFSSRLTLALHVLLYIMEYDKEEKITSEVLSDTTGVNSVNIRKLLAQLKSSKLIETKAGIGGTYLCEKPENISLKRIFDAVEPLDNTMFSFHKQPNTNCPVGRSIKFVVDKELYKVQNAMYIEMEKITLDDVYMNMKTEIEKH